MQIRLLGVKPISRTFHRKDDAQRWALETEGSIQRGEFKGGLPQVNLDGTEIYNAFKRAEDGDADVKSLDDINM